MKKAILLILVAIFVFSVFVLQVKAVETTLFSDNFEGYAIGTFPSSGGWELIWNGQGDGYQTIVDSRHFSGTKSFQLWGAPNWSAVAQKKFNSTSRKLGYEFAILIDSVGSGGPGRVEHPAFFNREAYVWGRYYASVNFNHDDMKIHADKGEVIGDWQTGTWYAVKVVLDRDVNKYDVWINGELKGIQLSTSNNDTDLINAIALVSDHAGVKVYYDDVRVFEGEAPSPTPLSVSIDPPSASINVGNSVTFTSTVSGGTPPYSYQWYLNDNPVSGATSSSWTFSPTASGIFYICLKVTDSLQPVGNAAQSGTARIVVTSVPVGGYSVSLTRYSTAMPSSVYFALLIMLSVVLTAVRRNTCKKNS
jgi:hypothetical protein